MQRYAKIHDGHRYSELELLQRAVTEYTADHSQCVLMAIKTRTYLVNTYTVKKARYGHGLMLRYYIEDHGFWLRTAATRRPRLPA